MTQGLESLNIKIFADGADLEGMVSLYRSPLIKGLTTNPTLMRKAGIQDYESFARDALTFILNKALKLVGTDLEALSLDTVKMFAQDAEKAGFRL